MDTSQLSEERQRAIAWRQMVIHSRKKVNHYWETKQQREHPNGNNAAMEAKLFYRGIYD